MCFDCIKVILKYWGFYLKKYKKKLPVAWVEVGAFETVDRCVTDRATRTHTFNGISKQYKEGKYA